MLDMSIGRLPARRGSTVPAPVGLAPVIAVPTRVRNAGDIKAWPNVRAGAIQTTYVEALWRAGCHESLLVLRSLSDDEADAYLGRADGLLLIGGGDVDPAQYGQSWAPEVYGVDEQSDQTEFALCRAALRVGLPVLAICRGMQVLNVVCGGTLDQHITGRAGTLDHGPPGGSASHHGVTVETGTRLAAVVGGSNRFEHCHSHHHQAIDRLGDGLVVSAHSEDGVIEAIELYRPVEQWVVGIQWHAERTAESDPMQHALFASFASFAREAAARRASIRRHELPTSVMP